MKPLEPDYDITSMYPSPAVDMADLAVKLVQAQIDVASKAAATTLSQLRALGLDEQARCVERLLEYQREMINILTIRLETSKNGHNAATP